MLKNIKTDERLQATSSMYSSRMIAESPYLGFSPQPGLRRCGKPSKGGLSTRGGWPQGSSPLWFFRPSRRDIFSALLRRNGALAEENLCQQLHGFIPNLQSANHHVSEHATLTYERVHVKLHKVVDRF